MIIRSVRSGQERRPSDTSKGGLDEGPVRDARLPLSEASAEQREFELGQQLGEIVETRPVRRFGPTRPTTSVVRSQSDTAAATAALLFSECVPGMRTTVRFELVGGVPNGSLSPWTT